MFVVSKKKYAEMEDYYVSKLKDKEKEIRKYKDLLSKEIQKNTKLNKKANEMISFNKNIESKNKKLEEKYKIVSSSKGGYVRRNQVLTEENKSLNLHVTKLEKQLEKAEKNSTAKDKTIETLSKENGQAHDEIRRITKENKNLRKFIEEKWGKKVPTTEEIKKYDKKTPLKNW